jgi:hypothetical protein
MFKWFVVRLENYALDFYNQYHMQYRIGMIWYTITTIN